MKAKAVMHLDMEEESRLETTLGNIENLFKEMPAPESDIRVVVHSKAVKLVLKDRASKHAEDIRRLSEKGVRFEVCNNSLTRMGIDRSQLLDSCEVIPSAIVELIRLQGDGFAYVKP